MTDSINRSADSAQLVVEVQYALEDNDCEEPPSLEQIQHWAQVAFSALDNKETSRAETTIRIVDEAEIQSLNREYRGKDQATNVLSFPFENEFTEIAELNLGLLGDIVLCHKVILAEARRQAKQFDHHYAHMVTHGILHLAGFDHDNDEKAAQMEALETKILAGEGMLNPYAAKTFEQHSN